MKRSNFKTNIVLPIGVLFFLIIFCYTQTNEIEKETVDSVVPKTAKLSKEQENKIYDAINVPYLLTPMKYQELYPIDNALCKSNSLVEEKFKLKLYSACNDLAKKEGLKMIKSMPEDQGMLFIYPNEQELNFWMDHTYLPLSIAYLDKDFKVVKTAEMIPLDRTGITSIVPAKYALELNTGMMKKLGIEEGVTLHFKPSEEELYFIPEKRFEDQDYELDLYMKYHNKEIK